MREECRDCFYKGTGDMPCSICTPDESYYMAYEKACDKQESITPLADAEIDRVVSFGTGKHGDAWKTRENKKDFDAAKRHMDAWENGELKDHETGLHPLAHAIARLKFILERELMANNK